VNHDTPKLTDKDVLKQAQQRLQQNLKLKAEGYLCTTEQLIHVLLGVAATRGTLESVCAELEQSVCAATIRGYVNQQLRVEELPQLEQSLNQALTQQLPPQVVTGQPDIAIDYHDQPYYGRTEQATGLWVRAEAKDGTTRVYRVATAYVILNGLRLTLAIKFVGSADNHLSVLKALLNRLKALALKARRLYLDRGFASGPVIRFLQQIQQPAIIACPIRGKRGGVRALCRGRKSYLTTHTFSTPTLGRTTATVAICRKFIRARRSPRRKKTAQWLVFILIHLQSRAQSILNTYRRRFGIETSYRCSRQLRGWTTSRNAAYRFVLIALSFLLVNVWLQLRWCWARKPRRGRRLLVAASFRLRRLAQFMAQALEALYGRVSHIYSLSEVKLLA